LPDFWITQLNYIALYSAGGALVWCCSPASVGSPRSVRRPFVGIGAYTSGLPDGEYLGFSPVGHGLCRPRDHCGQCLAGGLAITLRMSGHYLPLATIAWGLSLYYLMGNLDAIGQIRRHPGHPPPEELVDRQPGTSARAGLFFVFDLDAGAGWRTFALLNLLDSRTWTRHPRPCAPCVA
jgi:branched-chain amino acid transport system permease protein